MSLSVNIQHLIHDSVALQGDLPVEDLELDVKDEMVQPQSVLGYDLEAEKLEDAILVQGRLTLKLDCQCVRCLKAFAYTIDLPDWACHLPLTGDDATPIVNDCVDLTPHIREDILLGFPQHPVCEPECGGLQIASRGKSKKTSSTETGLPSSARSELDKLKL